MVDRFFRPFFGGVFLVGFLGALLPDRQVAALVGDNGAGKSTLIKGIVGIYPFDEGEVYFEDEQVHIHNPKDAAALGIEVVYQDLALADNLDVVANMFLGRERLSKGLLDEHSMEQAARDTLAGLGVRTVKSVRQLVSSLSGGQRQTVAIAKAVLWNSKVVLLDEPTAALGVAQTRQVLDLVRRLAEQGYAVVIISHNLHDIFEVADRITVLRLGQQVAVFERDATNQQEVVEAITAGSLQHVPGMEAEDVELHSLVRLLKPLGLCDYIHLQVHAKATLSEPG